MPRSQTKRQRKRAAIAVSERLIALIDREFPDDGDVDYVAVVVHRGYYIVSSSLARAADAQALLADAARGGGDWRAIRRSTDNAEGT